MIVWVAIILLVLILIQDVLLLILFVFNYRDHIVSGQQEEGWPSVSVVMTARNEADVLAACLKAFEEIDYPREKISFIVGNDQSLDKTSEILSTWAKKDSQRVFMEIRPLYRHINGKANALAQLIKMAKGELLLLTDADCKVGKYWAKEMVNAYQPRFGMVVGLTQVTGGNVFEKLQGLEWWQILGMIKVTSDLGLLLTAVGNNMLVSREAYEKVGGFEGLNFSVTEDFALGEAIKAKGYKPVHQFSAASLIETKGEKDLSSLLLQRKRWMRGARTLPLHWQLLLLVQVMFYPSIIVLLASFPFLAGVVWAVKWGLQSMFIRSLAKRARVNIPLSQLIIFELYYPVISWSTIVYYFWPSKINWKERKY
ncbi:glycosyltransferase [Echinicola marina]|uniref:glycosyltransferase n=1 Tax=Echinicola marina TaxID=2859768 RepID=UPI001CF6B61F|nr:glycosyltransferase [Echinicola marina]UCS93533.1 glycosyltransferase [Echinicola marina]